MLRNEIMCVKEKYVMATKKIMTPKRRFMVTQYVWCCTEKGIRVYKKWFLLHINIC